MALFFLNTGDHYSSERRNEYLKKMEMIEQAAIEADSNIYKYLLKGVTEGLSYGCLRADGLLRSRDYYYHRYRRFFYCLSRLRLYFYSFSENYTLA